MDIIEIKWIVLVILFFLTLMFSMLPLKLISTLRNATDELERAKYERIISLLSCFAGGVFMGTGLLDLFPEIKETLSKVNLQLYTKSSFPVAEFTVAFGFFLVLTIEQVVKDYTDRVSDTNLHNEQSELEGQLSSTNDSLQIEHDSVTIIPVYKESDPHPTLRSIFLLVALSLHSLFEGLAVGLQPNLNEIIQIFTAVIFHKMVIAFSLGLNLVQSNFKLSSIIKSNILFSITSPLGMGVALVLEEFGNSVNSSTINGILQGLACGTFFYVTFFEVLPHELGETGNRLFKVLAIILGFSIVCFVIFLAPTDPSEICPHP